MFSDVSAASVAVMPAIFGQNKTAQGKRFVRRGLSRLLKKAREGFALDPLGPGAPNPHCQVEDFKGLPLMGSRGKAPRLSDTDLVGASSAAC